MFNVELKKKNVWIKIMVNHHLPFKMMTCLLYWSPFFKFDVSFAVLLEHYAISVAYSESKSPVNGNT